MLVSDNDLEYLTEAEQIIEWFKEIRQSYDGLVY